MVLLRPTNEETHTRRATTCKHLLGARPLASTPSSPTPPTPPSQATELVLLHADHARKHTIAMEASWQRADMLYKKHLDKQRAKEEEQRTKAAAATSGALVGIGARGAGKQKMVKKIEASSDRRREARKEKLAQLQDEGLEEEEVQLTIQRYDGGAVIWATVVEDIRTFLQDHRADATVDEVSRGVGVDLLQDERILDALRQNPLIEVSEHPTGERLKYQPPMGVRNRGALTHLLSRTAPGSGDTEAVLRSEFNPELMYGNVETDLEELLAQGRCVRVDRTDKAEKAREMDFVLFAAPRGAAATEEVKALWKDVRVPEGSKLQDELIARKIRTREQMTKRQEARAAANRRQQEAAERLNPKKQRTGNIRTWANTHLGDAEELEQLFAKPG